MLWELGRCGLEVVRVSENARASFEREENSAAPVH